MEMILVELENSENSMPCQNMKESLITPCSSSRQFGGMTCGLTCLVSARVTLFLSFVSDSRIVS